MNVLLLNDEMLPGGVARHVTDLANGLTERGIGVAVAATDGPFRERLAAPVHFLPLPILRRGELRKNYPGILSSFRRLGSYLKDHEINIVHSHKRLSDFVGRIAAKRASIPHVATSHNTFTTLKRISRFGEETIAVSDAIRRNLIEDFGVDPDHVRTIHLGMKPVPSRSPDEVAKCKESIGALGKHVIASVGRLEKSKDRLTLLRAIALLQKNRQLEGFIVVIVGDGPERDGLRRTIRDLAIDSSVLILDSSTNVVDIFNAAEFCVISSIRDGGTLYVNLEAASLGKPHIATNVGGIPEFVIDGVTGLLVPPRSPQKLAEAIACLIRNREEVRRLGHNAFLRYSEHHGYDRFIDETIQVYEKALSVKPRKKEVA